MLKTSRCFIGAELTRDAFSDEDSLIFIVFVEYAQRYRINMSADVQLSVPDLFEGLKELKPDSSYAKLLIHLQNSAYFDINAAGSDMVLCSGGKVRAFWEQNKGLFPRRWREPLVASQAPMAQEVASSEPSSHTTSGSEGPMEVPMGLENLPPLPLEVELRSRGIEWGSRDLPSHVSEVPDQLPAALLCPFFSQSTALSPIMGSPQAYGDTDHVQLPDEVGDPSTLQFSGI